MNYTNKFFIDSNIIIEALKKNGLIEAKNIWLFILDNYISNSFYLNAVVKNEVIYHLYTKRKLIDIEEIEKLLNSFLSLEINNQVEKLMFFYVRTYKLKPNDTLILATCKHYGIPCLLSLDEDFKEAREKEGITLIDSVEKLKEVLNTSK